MHKLVHGRFLDNDIFGGLADTSARLGRVLAWLLATHALAVERRPSDQNGCKWIDETKGDWV